MIPVREVRVKIETGKIFRILSNDLDASAKDIAGLYKHRWQIELFFRWVKQNLKIKKFLGVSENAIRIQIAIALIAYLLLRLAHASQKKQFDAARIYTVSEIQPHASETDRSITRRRHRNAIG